MPSAESVSSGVVAATIESRGFFPPVQYSPLWGVLAGVLVFVVIAFYVLVPLLTRDPRRRQTNPEIAPFEIEVPLRQKYGDLIAEVEEAHRAGQLTSRAAHQRLSLLVRYFAFESTGMRAPTMTLDDLRAAQSPALSETVERLYPGAFAAIERGSVSQAAHEARRVVQPWS